MITLKKLKELIKDLPDDSMCYAYSGEITGIVIHGNEKINKGKEWFIGAGEINANGKDDTYTEGF